MEEMQDIKKTRQKIDCYEAKGGPNKSAAQCVSCYASYLLINYFLIISILSFEPPAHSGK